MSTVEAAVIGAGGPTGSLCVKKLLEENKSVRAVVRSPEKYKDKWPQDSKLNVVRGDVTDASTLESALEGVKGVIFAASGQSYFSATSVDKEGVRNTVAAAKKVGVKHIVLVTSALVTPKNRFKPIRLMLNNIRWGLMDAKFAGETILRESGVPYTIIRPGGLTNDPPGKAKLEAAQGDNHPPGRVSRGDVAAVCVAALGSSKAQNITLELSLDKAKRPAPGDPAQIFDGLKPGVF